MTKKKNDENSFVFYRSFYDVVNLIPDEAMRCRAYTAICEYGFYGVEPAEDEDVLVRMVFTQAKPQIDANKIYKLRSKNIRALSHSERSIRFRCCNFKLLEQKRKEYEEAILCETCTTESVED